MPLGCHESETRLSFTNARLSPQGLLMSASSRPASPTASTPLSEVEELALFEQTCARLIANPERLKVVIQKAGITDNLGRLTRRYGGR